MSPHHDLHFPPPSSPFCRTRNGICTLGPAPGPACVTPVELIIAALDTAFEWLAHAQLPSTPSSYTYSALPIIARIMSISIASEVRMRQQ